MNFIKNIQFTFLLMMTPFIIISQNNTSPPEYKGWDLVWHDEFNGSGLPDSSKWSYDVGGHGWGNNEQQYYLANSLENTYLKDGQLHIVAVKKDYENRSYTSAKLTTYNKIHQKYGKIEVKAKLPQGKGSWPAIWMLPVTIRTKEEPWPLCGEIDIMEHVGKDPGMVHTSLHSELYNHVKRTQITHFERLNDVFNEFHTYGIEWDENSIKFVFDGKLFYETLNGQDGRVATNEGWPFDKPYFLILNVAVGGNWGGEIDETIFPNEMIVDYVRIFKKK